MSSLDILASPEAREFPTREGTPEMHELEPEPTSDELRARLRKITQPFCALGMNWYYYYEDDGCPLRPHCNGCDVAQENCPSWTTWTYKSIAPLVEMGIANGTEVAQLAIQLSATHDMIKAAIEAVRNKKLPSVWQMTGVWLC